MKTNILYVKESDLPLTKTREGFLKKFILNKGYNTYFNKECTEIQCEKGRYRSITELNMMLKSRFKLTTLEGTLKLLKKIMDNDKCVKMVYCTTVKKVVMMYDKTPSGYISGISRNNYMLIKGEDGYSLEDYEKMCKSL